MHVFGKVAEVFEKMYVHFIIITITESPLQYSVASVPTIPQHQLTIYIATRTSRYLVIQFEFDDYIHAAVNINPQVVAAVG